MILELAGSIAMKDDYQIEFYHCNSEEAAEQSYSYNVEQAKSLDGVKKLEKSLEVNSHSRYSVIVSDQYFISSRIRDTYIYCSRRKQKR